MTNAQRQGTAVPAAVAGIDIGGTKISALLVDRAGTVLASGTVPAPAREGGAAMSRAAARLVQSLEATLGLRAIAAGVGAAGVVDAETGVIIAASESFTDWAGFGLGADLGERLGVGVAVDNDVNAFLLGETRYGAIAGSENALGIMLGTGVGGALALGGEVFLGARGAAGEIGHTPGYSDIVCTCGQLGHLETLASGRSIAARYSERAGVDIDAAVLVAARARAGDADAIATFDAAGHAIALAIATAVNLVDVQDVVIGGGVRGAWDVLEPALRETLSRHQPVSGYPLVVVPSALGGNSVAIGAAALAWQLADGNSADITSADTNNADRNSALVSAEA
ncbi:ROK family protein [Microterricola viridarii]|uniref:Glucokinase n=1 Tax=Microterricola viridarii TaxID=412690 RepID=A0A1H1S9R1_9MICO|nr:ROK family protein [Microterricola viridarii]SDS44727.1 glucokinase [Microterricola viridarii]